MKKTLSWKFLLPAFIIVYLISRSGVLGIISDTLGLLAAILFGMGVIDLGRTIFKKKKRTDTTPQS